MKKYTFLTIALLFGILFQSYSQHVIKPSGEIITKEYDFTGFTALNISNDFKAYVTFTDEGEKVSIEADDNLQEHIYVEMDGNTLKIRFKNNFNIRGKETLKAYISVKMINDFVASADSEIYLENKLETNFVKIKLSGDSKFEGALEIKEVDIDLKGDSEAYLTVIESINVKASGDSKLSYKGNAKVNNKQIIGDSELVKTK